MRRSEFDRAVEDEFGAQASTLITDLALSDVGGRTAAEALHDGIPPREGLTSPRPGYAKG